MSATYADTSFLCAIYLPESNSPLVMQYLAAHRRPLGFTSFQLVELRNAIRLAVFRRYLNGQQAEAALAQIEMDRDSNDFEEISLIWPDVVETAERLSGAHTARLGIRTLDLLHVAVAKTIGAKIFLTFDVRQHALAKAAGLKVGP